LPFLHSEKVAVVTGSSRGIGKAIALRLASEGANVAVCARSDRSTEKLPGSVGETAAAIQSLGRRALAIRMDVTNDQEIEAMVQKVVNEFGRVDILVNNAALAGLAGPGKPFLESGPELLDAFYRTNVRAPYLISRKIGAVMANGGGGAIVNISSRMGRLAGPPPTPRRSRGEVNMGYGISKAALDRFSAAIAEELLQYRIAVIGVYPGLTMLERLAGHTQLDLSGAESPEVTAKAVSFLCRDPMTHTGRFFISRDVVQQNGL
jgi:NAD(P)-dependent dehydrogenase (short-subunit alcohol dehydrogenase family)